MAAGMQRPKIWTKGGGGKRGSTGPPAYFLPEDLYSSFEPKSNLQFWRTRTAGTNNYKIRLGGLGQLLSSKVKQPPEMVITKPLEKEKSPEDKIVKFRWELRELAKARKQAEYALRTQQRLCEWDPYASKPNHTSDGYLTLFVARLSSKVTEEQLREFMKSQSGGGEIKHIRIIRNLKHPKRSYAFVEFEDEKSLMAAYKNADGVVFAGNHILVDVERGRTVRAWVPRRFGGGLGGPPRVKGHVLRKGRGAPEPPPPPPVPDNRKRQRMDRPYGHDRGFHSRS